MECIPLNLWQQAEELHEQAGLPYVDMLGYYMHEQYILKGPDWMIWGEPINDAWFIHLAIGKGAIPMFLKCMPFWLPKYGYARFLRKDHRLKIRDTAKLFRYYGIPLPPY